MVIQKRLVVLALFSLTLGSGCLFAYLEKQNSLTQLRLRVPKLVQEIKSIEEENHRLRYQIQEFEQPDNLLRLAADPHFCHLKHPLDQELLVIQEQTPIIVADGDFFAAGAQ